MKTPYVLGAIVVALALNVYLIPVLYLLFMLLLAVIVTVYAAARLFCRSGQKDTREKPA